MFARDPLAGDAGVAFEIAGLTPTNNPIVPIPEPRTWAMLAAGLIVLMTIRQRRLPALRTMN